MNSPRTERTSAPGLQLRALVYSEEPFFAEGLRCALALPGTLVVTRPATLLLAAVSFDPAILILHGPQLLPLCRLLPALREGVPGCRIILLASSVSHNDLLTALGLGASGVLPAQIPPAELRAEVARVAAGDLALRSTPREAAVPDLTEQEKRLLALICSGMKNKEIATALRLTEGTVKTYLNRLFKKTGAACRFDLALYGLANLPEEPACKNKRSSETAPVALPFSLFPTAPPAAWSAATAPGWI